VNCVDDGRPHDMPLSVELFILTRERLLYALHGDQVGGLSGTG